MEYLKELEIRRLFKELEFVEMDYSYQFEVIQVGNEKFFECVDNFLTKFPDLKEIFDSKMGDNIDSLTQSDVDIDFIIDNDVKDVDIEVESDPKDPELKNMFRKIVKNTHPDKITNSKLNGLYLTANQAYDNNDILSMVRVCSQLDIDINYDIHYNSIKSEIDTIKNKIKFLENTYTYKWLKCSDQEKDKILLEFVKTRIK